MCLAFAISFGLAAVSKVFAPIFWGSEFTVSGNLSMALAISIPFVSFADIIKTQYLIPNSKDTEYLISIILGAATNLIITLFFNAQSTYHDLIHITVNAERNYRNKQYQHRFKMTKYLMRRCSDYLNIFFQLYP